MTEKERKNGNLLVLTCLQTSSYQGFFVDELQETGSSSADRLFDRSIKSAPPAYHKSSPPPDNQPASPAPGEQQINHPPTLSL